MKKLAAIVASLLFAAPVLAQSVAVLTVVKW